MHEGVDFFASSAWFARWLMESPEKTTGEMTACHRETRDIRLIQWISRYNWWSRRRLQNQDESLLMRRKKWSSVIRSVISKRYWLTQSCADTVVSSMTCMLSLHWDSFWQLSWRICAKLANLRIGKHAQLFWEYDYHLSLKTQKQQHNDNIQSRIWEEAVQWWWQRMKRWNWSRHKIMRPRHESRKRMITARLWESSSGKVFKISFLSRCSIHARQLIHKTDDDIVVMFVTKI